MESAHLGSKEASMNESKSEPDGQSYTSQRMSDAVATPNEGSASITHEPSIDSPSVQGDEITGQLLEELADQQIKYLLDEIVRR